MLLTEAVRRGEASWPREWRGEDLLEGVLVRIDYHGVGALLNEARDCLDGWPQSILDEVRARALAQSMWELRSEALISPLLERLAARHLPSLLLKGSALAYDLYPNPALRARGDTDLLVRGADVEAAREVLRDTGLRRQFLAEDLPEGLRAQESWVFAASDGSTHVLDLHWHVLNAPALYEAFDFEVLWRTKRPLKRLGEAAFAPSRPMMLAHACVHRAFHECAPYFVGGRTYS